MSPDVLRFESLGTTCELFGVGIDHVRLAEGRAWIEDMHSRLTRFDAASELSRFNGSAGEWVAVSPELESLLRDALRAHDLSGGLVHAAVLGALMAAGYGRTFAAGPTTVLETVTPGALPALPRVLEVTPGAARLRQGFGIDLGGIAKGWLADRLASWLGPNCLVNLGGDLYARGAGPSGEGWPVGFGGTTVLLRDRAAATSGTHRRAWGEGLHHLVDPRTERPAETDLVEVSVVAATAADAEVHAKTALLLGRAAAPYYLGGCCSGWNLR
ncbi:MAG TPA: FAD:protein FMN transferase [Candidatus Dormibacteraeota bacterium]|nr:FAD:protein FMN transferase [Candidatus Dormibacteraeota bacterium]